jgi:hypothetical protein
MWARDAFVEPVTEVRLRAQNPTAAVGVKGSAAQVARFRDLGIRAVDRLLDLAEAILKVICCEGGAWRLQLQCARGFEDLGFHAANFRFEVRARCELTD